MLKTSATTVKDYLSAQEPPVRKALEKLRKVIKAAAPEAEEVISYQIPTYKQNGAVVGFAAFPKHLGFYIMSPKLMPKLIGELKGYKYAGATIHFSPEKPLPDSLVKKIVKARLEENKARVDKVYKAKSGK